MTTTKDLIERLIHTENLPNASGQWFELTKEAAAHLCEQQDEIARLDSVTRESWRQSLLERAERTEADGKAAFDLSVECRNRAVKAEAERDALRTELLRPRVNWQQEKEFAEERLESESYRANNLLRDLNRMCARAARAEAERDALRQDAERYREVKKYAQSGMDMTTNGVKGKTVWKIRLPDASWHSDAWTGPTLDAAIDAAREKK